MYDCFVNNHSGDRFAVSFLLRRINTVSLRVYCQAVYFLLNRKVFELAVVLGIVHLEYRDGSARTGHVNALQSGVELDDVGTSGHRQEGNRLLLVEIEHGHQVISFAGEEGAMMFRVQSRSEEHTSELQSLRHLVCRLLLEKKNTTMIHKLL